MKQSSSVEVTGLQGLRGTIDTSVWPLDGSRPQVQILLADGRRVMVALDLLECVDDRHYRLPVTSAALAEHDRSGGQPAAPAATEGPVVVPVIQEQATVAKRTVESGRVRVRKVVREEEETIDEPLAREEVTVERVPVGRVVDRPQPSRREGEDWIIPIVEEVLVVEKRLMLKEELRVRKRVVQERHQETVTLRREEAVVERLPAQGAPAAAPAANVPRPPGATDASASTSPQHGTTIAPDRATNA